jgi:hypothetical protein
MPNNYADFGISFTSEPVAQRAGPNATDRKVIGNGQIAVVTDLNKFVEHFGADVVLGILDGTSIRVMSQDVSRRGLTATPKASDDQIREAIYNRLKGVRNRGGGTREVVIHVLPNGEKYTGSDLAEFQSLYAAALVDAGVDADTAIMLAGNQKL